MKTAADPLTIYCPACNEAFLGVLRGACCPRCGVPVQINHVSLQTVISTGSGHFSRYDSSVDDGEQDNLHSLVGTELDRYSLDTFLGRGGMGWVFLARHRQLNRPCAVKILSPSLIKKDPDYLDRFHREGQAAASLNHPNVVTVHAIGHHQELNFLEMEYVPGRPLQKILGECALMPTRAAYLALGIANGLGAAHRIGIVHRDLKPDNVLLTLQGVPKLGDFGLAKRLHGKIPYELPGTLAGTPHFMAPELFVGADATPASDVYALGVTLYVLLTGQLPYFGHSLNALANAIQNEPPPNLRALRADIPLEICECLWLMMEKSPANRPQNGIEASQLLQAILGQTRDLETLMHEAFAHMPHVTWLQEGNRYCATVMLPNGRRQMVFIDVSAHEVSERLLQIYSLCGPADASYHAEALRLNSSMAHGALALREVAGREFFVTLNNYPRATVDAEEIRRSVLELAIRADTVERVLTGQDCH